ncbi:MAG: 1-acyl-sn-glycerol-3-phosphate acyltransferase [Lachnospiraceae bacterium]|nr:1-acyl-sn-glycerol-3-phosphate acyltransferase [Lachnospiraceae bacterium]
MIRTILIVLFLIVYLISSIFVWIFEAIVGVFSKKAMERQCFHFVQWGFRCIRKIAGIRLETIGLEDVPRDQPVLYIGNHCSFFDIVISYSQVPGITGFISKKEVKKVPLLSTWMTINHCLFLDRKDLRQGLKVITDAIEEVRRGYSIFIYPEGTRSKDGKLGDFKAGSFKISTRTDCPIIPVAITNSSDVFEDHLPFIKPTKVIIRYGAPIIPSQLAPEDKKHINDYTRGIIAGMLEDNKKHM